MAAGKTMSYYEFKLKRPTGLHKQVAIAETGAFIVADWLLYCLSKLQSLKPMYCVFGQLIVSGPWSVITNNGGSLLFIAKKPP